MLTAKYTFQHRVCGNVVLSGAYKPKDSNFFSSKYLTRAKFLKLGSHSAVVERSQKTKVNLNI